MKNCIRHKWGHWIPDAKDDIYQYCQNCQLKRGRKQFTSREKEAMEILNRKTAIVDPVFEKYKHISLWG